MIGYLDTSAFVPLLIAEPSSEPCRRFWDDADVIVSSRLLYVETAAALAQARRMGRLSDETHTESLLLLDRMWSEIDVTEVDDDVVTRAAGLAHELALRGYDAVHCASAEQLNDEDVVAASGDQRLLDAWAELGMATFDTHGQSGHRSRSAAEPSAHDIERSPEAPR
ncbi:MAG: PIN domain-containing protein [Actinophytocola sp.]|nr:PIN domain-containing protein [Actinophytocola sp.]